MWAFLDLDLADVFEDLVLAFGLESDGGGLVKLESVTSGVSARDARKNTAGHELDQARKASKAVTAALEDFGVLIVGGAFHNAGGGDTVDSKIVRSVYWLRNAA